jgi:hypothetical protein
MDEAAANSVAALMLRREASDEDAGVRNLVRTGVETAPEKQLTWGKSPGQRW